MQCCSWWCPGSQEETAEESVTLTLKFLRPSYALLGLSKIIFIVLWNLELIGPTARCQATLTHLTWSQRSHRYENIIFCPSSSPHIFAHHVSCARLKPPSSCSFLQVITSPFQSCTPMLVSHFPSCFRHQPPVPPSLDLATSRWISTLRVPKCKGAKQNPLTSITNSRKSHCEN